jgi:predicted RNA binding protein YcfA (HicA-like mRNA interferase family)
MKRGALLKALRKQGCVFVEHCKKHDRYLQPKTGITDQVPRHSDINETLAKQIMKNLSQ